MTTNVCIASPWGQTERKSPRNSSPPFVPYIKKGLVLHLLIRKQIRHLKVLLNMQICWFQADLLSHTHATTYVSQLFTLDLENTHGMFFFSWAFCGLVRNLTLSLRFVSLLSAVWVHLDPVSTHTHTHTRPQMISELFDGDNQIVFCCVFIYLIGVSSRCCHFNYCT